MTNEITATSLDDINNRVQTIVTKIEGIQSALNDSLTEGPVAAQTACLVAFALAKQAYSMVEQIGQTVQYLSKPDSLEDNADGDSENIFDALVEVASEILEAMTEQFGVEKAAITPFLYETTVIMLPVVEDLVARAEAKIELAAGLSAKTA